LDYQQTNLEGWQSTLPVENRLVSAKLSYHEYEVGNSLDLSKIQRSPLRLLD